MTKWAKPHEWNMGAAMTVVSAIRMGIRPSSASPDEIASPCRSRWAPLGVPVVPEVRIVAAP